MPNFLRKTYFGLLYILPAILFFSYHPIIKLGQNSSMNFELSLPLIWLVVFSICAFLNLTSLHWHKPKLPPKKYKSTALGFNFPGISDRKIFLTSLFPFFTTLSIFWSANPLRALLTAGIIWLLFLSIFAILYLTPLLHPPKSFTRNLIVGFFASSFIICVICWLQSLLDLLGASRFATLLCIGCTYHSFGFPHPSGFAIEPQFMGNLLLAPTLAALYFLSFHRAKIGKREFRLLALLAVIFSATLFLTFSRGAIYAYAIAIIILIIFTLYRRTSCRLLVIIPILTFGCTLAAQGIFSAIGPTDETFLSGITKSIHQLSLGRIDLRDLVSYETETTESESAAPDSMTAAPAPDTESAIFEGYVVESTNVRLSLNEIAFRTWITSPYRIIFGVGLGSAGVAMHAYAPSVVTSPKEIVQNEVFSLLLELGIMGILLLGIALFVFFSPRSEFWHSQILPLLVSLLAAYFITLQFFSGLPNALHIYLLPPLFYLWAHLNLEKTPHKLQKS